MSVQEFQDILEPCQHLNPRTLCTNLIS